MNLEVHTAGQGGKELIVFSPGISACGDIGDGIAVWTEGLEGYRGCFVFSFADLERLYSAACEARGRK